MTQQDCIIYTAKPSKRLTDAGKIAEQYLNQTPGRHISIVWRKVKSTNKIPTEKDEKGKVRINWLWFRAKFASMNHDLIGFHFSLADRKRFKLTEAIDGSSHFHLGVGYFYLCASPLAISPGYDTLPEVAQLIIHEIGHIDTKLTGAPDFLVHALEKQHRIHELPALLTYEELGVVDKLAVTLKQLYAVVS